MIAHTLQHHQFYFTCNLHISLIFRFSSEIFRICPKLHNTKMLKSTVASRYISHRRIDVQSKKDYYYILIFLQWNISNTVLVPRWWCINLILFYRLYYKRKGIGIDLECVIFIFDMSNSMQSNFPHFCLLKINTIQ